MNVFKSISLFISKLVLGNERPMSHKKRKFLKAVRHEIMMLRKYATKDELNLLNFSKFNASSPTRCIYGQMTRSCESDRAKVLMDKACIRVLDLPDGASDITNTDIEDPEFSINGRYTGQTWKSKYKKRTYSHLSALEGYICTKGANIKGIIAYLKGESTKLVL